MVYRNLLSFDLNKIVPLLIWTGIDDSILIGRRNFDIVALMINWDLIMLLKSFLPLLILVDNDLFFYFFTFPGIDFGHFIMFFFLIGNHMCPFNDVWMDSQLKCNRKCLAFSPSANMKAIRRRERLQ